MLCFSNGPITPLFNDRNLEFSRNFDHMAVHMDAHMYVHMFLKSIKADQFPLRKTYSNLNTYKKLASLIKKAS